MKKIIYAFFLPVLCFCQKEMSDTLESVQLTPSTDKIHRDTVLKRTFYKTQSPTVYFFDESNSLYDNKIMMAVQKDSVFVIYKLWDVTDRKEMKFERFDFDGIGNKELVIRWKHKWHHMAATYEMKTEEGGTQIINLDKLEFYFDNRDYMKVDWKESEDPYEGERPKAISKKKLEDAPEEGDDNFRHNVFIKKRTISITRIKQGSKGIKYIPVATYKLGQQKALVKIKTKKK